MAASSVMMQSSSSQGAVMDNTQTDSAGTVDSDTDSDMIARRAAERWRHDPGKFCRSVMVRGEGIKPRRG